MSTIFVVGLGFGDLSSMPVGTYQKLQSGLPLYFRTRIHPAAEELLESGVRFQSFDGLYETLDSFAAIYEEIAEQLWKAAESRGDIVYAVPGHPLMAEQSVQNLIQRNSSSAQVKVEVGSGHSFLDAVCETLAIDAIQGLLLLDGTALQSHQLRPDVHTLVAQVFSRDVASDVKLTLMEVYPDDYPVTVVRAAGVKGMKTVVEVPLYSLDRVDSIDHLTTVYIPPTDNETILCGQPWYVADLVARLRAPDGCPWDREQTHASLRRFMLEEAYEAVHAVDGDSPEEFAAELGDVLLQVLLNGQIASEAGEFDTRDIYRALGTKLLRRHPHVFGDVRAANAEEAEEHWRRAKAAEAATESRETVLAGVKDGQPAWHIARELQHRAAKVGFDWPAVEEVYLKMREELDEFGVELGKREHNLLLNELGDLLFVIVNAARWLDLDIEVALTQANQKFVRRFGHVEQRVKERGGWDKHSLSELDEFWKEAKQLEKE